MHSPNVFQMIVPPRPSDAVGIDAVGSDVLRLPCCLTTAPPQRKGSRQNMADFAWRMTAIDWGFSIEDTAAKLVEVSERARKRVRLKDEGCALITAQNAATAAERNARKQSTGGESPAVHPMRKYVLKAIDSFS